jgi:hypothetical protein
MTTCASMAIQALVARYGIVKAYCIASARKRGTNMINSKPQELCGPRADLIRRAFWYCCMMETFVTDLACTPKSDA